MNTATILRIHRDYVGREFPFDKVYLFHKKHEAMFPKIFGTGLAMPLSKKMVTSIESILTKMGTRNESLGLKWWPFDRKPEAEVASQMKSWRKPKNYRERPPLGDILDSHTDYFAVVPILFTRQKVIPSKTRKELKNGKKKIYPQYLVARKRRVSDRSSELLGKMLSARAYFMYGGKTYRPICLLCPRSIDSVVGECNFGSQECYGFLSRIGEGDFVRGLKDYVKLARDIDEPQLELEESDAKLSTNPG